MSKVSHIDAVAEFRNCFIMYNAGMYGGVFTAENRGTILVYDSLVNENFGVFPGVANVYRDGQLEFHN